MSRKPEDTQAIFLDELGSGSLRQAVDSIRSDAAPDAAMDCAIQRAQELTTVSLAVQRHPAKSRDSRFGVLAISGVLCLVLVVGLFSAFSNTYYEANIYRAKMAQDSREVADGPLMVADRDLLVDDSKSMRYVSGYIDEQNRPAFSTVSEGRGADTVSKIIHSANVSLVVGELTKTESELRGLVKRFEGLIGNSQISEPNGYPRSANWVVRIPAESLEDFLDEIVDLGTPENRSTNAQDVSEEYIDLEKRVKNKRLLEERILSVLKENTGGIKDVLAVEEQLARVREEIERMQARINRIDTDVAMTTVSISAREEQNYVPPQAPTFSTEIGRAWTASIATLQNFGKFLVLLTVALGPWLPLILIASFAVFRIVKRRRASQASE